MIFSETRGDFGVPHDFRNIQIDSNPLLLLFPRGSHDT